MPWLLFPSTLLGLALVFAFGAPWRRAVPSAPVRVSAELGVDASLVYLNAGAAAVLSPDGSLLAFVAQKSGAKSQLFVRRLEQLQASPLSGTEGASSPFFSPDGQWIGFFADAKLKKVSATGGASVTLCDAPAGRGGAWAEDGTIVFSPSNSPGVSLQRVSSAGGKPEPLTTLGQGETTQRFPQVLPGGKAVLYMSANANGNYDEANLVVQPLPSGPRKVVVRGGYYGRYLPSGHLVYMYGGTLFAAPFDLDRLETTGQPVPAIEGVTSSSASGGGAQFAVSATGTLVYLPGQSVGGTLPVQWMDRFGKTTILRGAGALWSNPQFAPDGRRLAMDISDTRQTDVWVYDWERDTASRLTIDAAADEKPVWTPDGRRIVFRSNRNNSSPNLYCQRADGTGEVQRLTESKTSQMPASWHPSGKFLAFQEINPQTGIDVMILPLEGDEASGWKPGQPTAFINSSFAEQEPMFSPDGRWLAYYSNDNGRDEVYVRPFPGPGGKWQVSTGGGDFPTWSRTRHELFYSTPDQQIMVAAYTVEGDSFRVEKPRLWSERRFVWRPRQRHFDLHPDGDRFALAVIPEGQTLATQDKVVFIFNFFDELRRIAPRTK